MTNEEVKEIVARADDEYDRLKDRVHEQYDEIKRLNNIIKEIEDFCIAMGKMYEEDYKDTDIASIFNICILNKIKELKESDKE